MRGSTVQVQIVGVRQPKRRPARLVETGRKLHPVEVTDAWYAADCPKPFDVRAHGISLGVWLKWRAACWLRGCA